MKRISISFLWCLILVIEVGAVGKIIYPAAFNPMKGLLKEIEQDYRKEICLNGTWDFMPVYDIKASEFTAPARFDRDQTPIKIPSPWNVNDFTDGEGGDFVAYPSYPEKWKEAKAGWMRKKVNVPHDWAGKQLKLHFEGILGKSVVYVNGQEVGADFELFLPIILDVTAYVKPGQENEIVVGVAKSSLFNEPGKYGSRTYVGGSMWGIEMAGIWQDVYLFALPEVHIEDIFIQPYVGENLLQIEATISNNTNKPITFQLEGEVRRWYNLTGRTLMEAPEEKGEFAAIPSLVFPELKKQTIAPNSVHTISLKAEVAGELDFWTPETPELYGAVVKLVQGKQTIDLKCDRFGWREFKISGDRLLLNGKPVELKGDSWHFTGVPQMTRRYAWSWYNMLKDANANAVRFHAQPFPRFYLDMADEMGICVLDETGIWSSDGGPKIDSEAYWESCVDHIRRLIKRDRNHASVFGWSVCNETVPVAVHVFKAPEELVERQLEEINRWVRVVQKEDPTRSWISGDGETDRPTILPTIVGHYGGMEGMKNWSTQGKPWGIGEQSMAYYGTPKQVAEFNGDRAYENMEGRMEGVAIESYNLIKTQRENNASYSCVFNLAWYSLQPLELGLANVTGKPTLEDGIFFSFNEGAYGMQPERLGPYTTTFNPGYDNSLPLYRPWSLFDAVKAANATPIQPNPVVIKQETTNKEAIVPADVVILLSGSASTMKNELEKMGIEVKLAGNLSSESLIIIDGNIPPVDRTQINLLHQAIQQGARVLVWGINPQSVAIINSFLSFPVMLEERTATSFLVHKEEKEMQGLTHGDFYFSELLPRGRTAMHYGLSGEFMIKARPLLSACNAEWQRWNYRAETSKTANVFRSEREAKGAGTVIASTRIGKSELIISSLDLKDIRQETQAIFSRLLTNLGAKISGTNLSKMTALNEDHQLHRALVWGPVYTHDQPIPQMLKTDFIGGESSVVPELNVEMQEDQWRVIAGTEEGVLEFSNAKASGDRRAPVVYMSYWMFSPRSLSDLLAEPDMPGMDMYLTAQGGTAVWLNGKQIASEEIGTDREELKIANVLLDKGWNHFLIKLVRNREGGDVKANVRFDSPDKKFMEQVLSSIVR